MPTPYFDYTNDDHLAWLPRAVRDEEDLESIAMRAEAQVINHFTVSVVPSAGLGGLPRFTAWIRNVPDGALEISDDRAVCLRGYAIDSLDATVALRQALMHAIADQIRWVRARNERKPGVTSESSGGKGSSEQYGANDAERLRICPDVFDWLLEFDVRPPLYSV